MMLALGIAKIVGVLFIGYALGYMVGYSSGEEDGLNVADDLTPYTFGDLLTAQVEQYQSGFDAGVIAMLEKVRDECDRLLEDEEEEEEEDE